MNWFARGTIAALAASVAALAWGCGGESFQSSTGSTGASADASAAASTGAGTSSASSGSGGGGPACKSLGDACTGCELKACPDIYCACADNPECGLLAICAAKCGAGDAMCEQKCWSAHPSAISEGALLTDCAALHCPTDCPGYTPIGKCYECLYSKCDQSMNDCVSKPACTDFILCSAACNDDGCRMLCATKYPEGLTLAAPVAQCTKGPCAVDCPG